MVKKFFLTVMLPAAVILLATLVLQATATLPDSTRPLLTDTTSIVWQPGYLDIHHIETGSGNSAFIIMPDGTTLLVDAGDIGDRKLRHLGYPLTSTPPYPDDSKTAGQWIVDYIKQALPTINKIDYALITHYHDDHLGGLMDVGNLLPITKLIDRGNDFPTDLKKYYHQEPNVYLSYQRFIASQHLVAEQLKVGSTSQIIPVHKFNALFSIRGVKANGEIWTGIGNKTFTYLTADSVLNNGKFEENPLSLAIKISYGKFDYYTGGDNTGLQDIDTPIWYDVETPIAKAVGKVEAMTLDHHGCRDAVNQHLLSCLQPQTIIQQSWSSNHPGEEVLHRLISKRIYPGEKSIFATNIQDATKATLGFWLTDNYKSTFGHVIIRVLPGGNTYYVLIAETIQGKVTVKEAFGPYECE
jgi:beta-lactamase superfamily II metal-dependent hydrolase